MKMNILLKTIVEMSVKFLLLFFLSINLTGCITTATALIIDNAAKFKRNANLDPDWKKYILV
jgi:hypothetical protein